MTKKILTFLVLIPLLSSQIFSNYLIPFEVDLSSKGFKKLKTRKGVTVYLHKDIKVIKVAAEGIIKGPPHIVMEELINYKAQEKLVGRLSKAEIIQKGKDWMIVYHHINLPVISDRDYTLKVKFGNSQKIYYVKYEVTKDHGPEKKNGIIRVSYHKAGWQLRSINNGNDTYLRFQVMIDMAGLLPKWVARSGAVRELPDVFEGMRMLVKKRLNHEIQITSP